MILSHPLSHLLFLIGSLQLVHDICSFVNVELLLPTCQVSLGFLTILIQVLSYYIIIVIWIEISDYIIIN